MMVSSTRTKNHIHCNVATKYMKINLNSDILKKLSKDIALNYKVDMSKN